MPTIGNLKRGNENRQGDPYYQSKKHKRNVPLIWARDNGKCQLCKEKGIYHPLVRGTKVLNNQGTVDHKKPRKSFDLNDPEQRKIADSLENQWLIGSNHHAKKSQDDKKYYR